MLRRAELIDGRIVDVRIDGGRIAEVREPAPTADGDPMIDAAGGLLLPGLHDHHIHVAAAAAALASVRCGPPEVESGEELAQRLGGPGEGWLRGIGYHESVAGMIDRDWLDRAAPHRPVRVQHRGGRMWVFNSAGLELLLALGLPAPPGLEQEGGRWTGRLFDEDHWLREALGSGPPPFYRIGTELARFGITGLTDMSPGNDDAMAAWFTRECERGALPQQRVLAGKLELSGPGPVKIHLHEEHLPPFEQVVATIRAAHERGRAVAVHCVTDVELLFTLGAFRDAGACRGDRIEHASIASDEAVDQIAALGLAVVVQPHFVAERGDAYRSTIASEDWPHLYRLRVFLDSGVTLAGGSDAPFGQADPWAAMAAAVSRRTRGGCFLGEAEALTPEAALRLFLADPQDLSLQRRVEPGAPADLCLLTKPWNAARETLSADLVRATLIGGRIVHQHIDKAPG